VVEEVQEKIQLLRDLQDIDQQLNEIRKNRQVLETEQATLDSDVARVQAMVDSLTESMALLQGDRQELSRALLQEQDNVGKAESRLPSIKTQKEYVAVLKEIDTAKKLNKDLQDQILKKDQEIAALENDKQEKETELNDLSQQVGERKAQIGETLADYDRTLQERGEQRDGLVKGLPADIAKRYKLLFERRNGIAVVEARNGACLGCNMHLPPQLFNNLYSATQIHCCPHCNRLLFIDQGK